MSTEDIKQRRRGSVVGALHHLDVYRAKSRSRRTAAIIHPVACFIGRPVASTSPNGPTVDPPLRSPSDPLLLQLQLNSHPGMLDGVWFFSQQTRKGR